MSEKPISALVIGGPWRTTLQSLDPDWNSYGAKPISGLAIATIDKFATVPCSDGGIQLEVHRDGFDIEIMIGPDGRIKSASLSARSNKPIIVERPSVKTVLRLERANQTE
jgi:hypothetical protein